MGYTDIIDQTNKLQQVISQEMIVAKENKELTSLLTGMSEALQAIEKLLTNDDFNQDQSKKRQFAKQYQILKAQTLQSAELGQLPGAISKLHQSFKNSIKNNDALQDAIVEENFNRELQGKFHEITEAEAEQRDSASFGSQNGQGPTTQTARQMGSQGEIKFIIDKIQKKYKYKVENIPQHYQLLIKKLQSLQKDYQETHQLLSQIDQLVKKDGFANSTVDVTAVAQKLMTLNHQLEKAGAKSNTLFLILESDPNFFSEAVRLNSHNKRDDKFTELKELIKEKGTSLLQQKLLQPLDKIGDTNKKYMQEAIGYTSLKANEMSNADLDNFLQAAYFVYQEGESFLDSQISSVTTELESQTGENQKILQARLDALELTRNYLPNTIALIDEPKVNTQLTMLVHCSEAIRRLEVERKLSLDEIKIKSTEPKLDELYEQYHQLAAKMPNLATIIEPISAFKDYNRSDLKADNNNNASAINTRNPHVQLANQLWIIHNLYIKRTLSAKITSKVTHENVTLIDIEHLLKAHDTDPGSAPLSPETKQSIQDALQQPIFAFLAGKKFGPDPSQEQQDALDQFFDGSNANVLSQIVDLTKKNGISLKSLDTKLLAIGTYKALAQQDPGNNQVYERQINTIQKSLLSKMDKIKIKFQELRKKISTKIHDFRSSSPSQQSESDILLTQYSDAKKQNEWSELDIPSTQVPTSDKEIKESNPNKKPPSKKL